MDHEAILGLLGSLYTNLLGVQTALAQSQAENIELRAEVARLHEQTGGASYVDMPVE